MGELDDEQQAYLFDTLLSDADKWHMPPHAQSRRAAETDETVADDLALVAALRELQPSRNELSSARARVGQRLAEAMRAEPAAPSRLQSARAWLRAVTSPPILASRVAARTGAPAVAAHQTAEERRERLVSGLRRLSAFGLALLVVIISLLAGASAASAHALPESPLYMVKRAEESTLLAFSWTDDSKGQTLTMIANHRIVEAAAEAGQRHTPEACSLLNEFDSALSQLIDLTAHAQATHEDTSVLARAIQATLETEQSVATQAATHGESTFAQATTASAQAATAHLARAGIELPKKSRQNNGQHNGQGNGQGSDQNNGQSSTPTESSQTPTPKATHVSNGASSSSQATPVATAGSATPHTTQPTATAGG